MKKTIATAKAPAAIGPYSQAVFFPQDKPARACFQVAAVPKDALLEIEAIAGR